MKHGKTLQELAIEIERQNASKQDYIADTRQINFTTFSPMEKTNIIQV